MTSVPSTEASIEKSVSFFRGIVTSYFPHVNVLDAYRSIRVFTNGALGGVDWLLDAGSGGTSDYDVNLV